MLKVKALLSTTHSMVTGPSAIRVSLAVLTWFLGPYLVRWFEIPVLF